MNTVIIGMGALGLLFGDMISSNADRENTVFLMDKDRYERHSKDIYRINGKEKTFRLASADIPGSVPFETADLVIIATKYNGLDDAVSMMKPYTDDNTVIISLLNGIISEDIISQTYNRDNIIDCVPIGMDAMRDGCSVNYTKEGRLQIGVRQQSQRKAFDRLCAFFDKAHVPYEAVDDIRHAMRKNLSELYSSRWSNTRFVFFSDLGSVLIETIDTLGVTFNLDLKSLLISSAVAAKSTLPSASAVTMIISLFLLSSCAISILYSLDTPSTRPRISST